MLDLMNVGGRMSRVKNVHWGSKSKRNEVGTVLDTHLQIFYFKQHKIDIAKLSSYFIHRVHIAKCQGHSNIELILEKIVFIQIKVDIQVHTWNNPKIRPKNFNFYYNKKNHETEYRIIKPYVACFENHNKILWEELHHNCIQTYQETESTPRTKTEAVVCAMPSSRALPFACGSTWNQNWNCKHEA